MPLHNSTVVNVRALPFGFVQIIAMLSLMAIAMPVLLLAPENAEAALVRTTHITENGDTETFPYTTTSFTPSDNSLLVVALSFWDLDETGADTSLTLEKVGNGLNATKRATIRNDGGQWVTTIWTASVGTGSSMQLVLDGYGGDGFFVMRVYDYTGYDIASPVGGIATGKGVAADSITLSSAPSLTSEVLAVMSAASDFTEIAPGAAGFSEIADSTAGGVVRAQNQIRTDSVSTTVDWSVNGGSDGEDKTSAAIEIKAGAADGPARVIRLNGRVQLWGGVHLR